MARYTEIVAVDKSFPAAWTGAVTLLSAHPWRVVSVRDTTLFVRERLSLESMLSRNPCRFAVFIRPVESGGSELHIFGSTFGFGPIASGRIRKVTATLKEQMLAAIARAEPPPELLSESESA